MPPRPSVEQELFDSAYRFDFYRAVKLLEQLSPDRLAVAEGQEPHAEAARFQASMSAHFPASEVDSVRAGENSGPPVMRVNFLGLAGAHGPLPPPYTDLLAERVWRGDTALRDFLDIFNHRLISLMYRTRQKHRPGLEGDAPWDSRFAGFLFSLIGLGTPGLQYRMQISDHALLFYTGLLAHQPRSLAALEALLRDYFQTPVEAVPFIGQWLRLEDSETTRLGACLGRNQALGRNALLGNRAWDQQGKFEVCLGPLTLERFLDFLPIGWGFIPLCELTRFFVGPELDYDFRLRLKAAEVPACRLHSQQGARLGWSSWLKSQPFGRDPEVRLSARLLYHPPRAAANPLFDSLPPGETAALLQQARTHTFPAHCVVVKQGEQSDSLFLIVSGAVQVVRQGLDGNQHILATLHPGEFFGEFALLTGQSRSATIVTLAESKILELRKADLDEAMEKHPRMAQVMRAFSQARAAHNRPPRPGQG